MISNEEEEGAPLLACLARNARIVVKLSGIPTAQGPLDDGASEANEALSD